MTKGSNIVEMIEPAPDCLKISREAWSRTHPELRAEILRMEKEFAAGFEKYRPAAERDAEMAEWHEYAAAKNTTLPEALGRYVTMQRLLESNPLLALQIIARNTGLDLEAWARGVLEREPDEAVAG
jgi:hypothetical protein